jgi:hypothetical protein
LLDLLVEPAQGALERLVLAHADFGQLTRLLSALIRAVLGLPIPVARAGGVYQTPISSTLRRIWTGVPLAGGLVLLARLCRSGLALGHRNRISHRNGGRIAGTSHDR